MDQELEKAVKKYNKIYVIELFVIAAILVVLATLKITGIIGTSANFRHVFNIITLVASLWIISDFVWLCFSKKRQRRNSWFDKISLLPFAVAMIVVDIICLIHWNDDITYYSTFISIAFYYIALIYVAQGIVHIYKPSPAIVSAAIEEYKEKQIELQKAQEESSKEKEDKKEPKEDK